MEVDESSSSYINSNSVHQVKKECIVIGCKNGCSNESDIKNYSSSSVRYFQVPSLNSSTSLLLTKQWYINTLREDLFDELVKKQQQHHHPTAHFVCIEHFDEDSFVDNNIATNNQPQQLKSDAVPSLFEIEVTLF